MKLKIGRACCNGFAIILDTAKHHRTLLYLYQHSPKYNIFKCIDFSYRLWTRKRSFFDLSYEKTFYTKGTKCK